VKGKYASILLTLIGLLGMGAAAKAQIRGEIKVTLPFEFMVDAKTLPAGTYTVSRFADDKYQGLILSNYESRTSVFVHPVGVEGASADKPQVSFQRIGEQHFLSRIRTSHDVYKIDVPLGHVGGRSEIRRQHVCLREFRRQLARNLFLAQPGQMYVAILRFASVGGG